ncbi:MAG: hypothetical protein WCK09_18785 [Bacteroidota bacterium]
MKRVKRIFFVVILFAVFSTIHAQTYEEWLKQEQANFSKFRIEQEKALEAMRKDYANYVKQRDKDYSDYLKKGWENFPVSTAKKPPEKPKPAAVPAYKPAPGAPVTRMPIVTAPLDIPMKIPTLVKLPVIQKPEPADYPEDSFSFNFCGARVTLDVDLNLKNMVTGKKGKQAITDFWDRASKTNYNSLVNQLMAAKSKFNMNDYGYFMLIQETAANIYSMPDQQDYSLLLEWFLMVRSGYDVRIAYNENQIAILLPSYNTLYSKKFLTINHLNYYFFSPFEGNDISTYDKCYDLANAPIDFNIASPMNFGSKPVKKSVPFTYKNKTYPFAISYDPGVIQFYKNYPQVEMETYFNAAISMDTKQTMAESFKPILANLSEKDALNFILNFVQTAFTYKTDQEQFGKEKFFFAEELFYYPACDCEDRSALFAYMVRDLLGLKVVGLETPNHMFTAVHCLTDVFGDYVQYQGEQYIVADPTFINAPFGRTMPEQSLQNAKIIAMNNPGQEALTRDHAWDLAMKSGIKKASNFQNLVFDKAGNFYVTGYFAGTINMGSFTAKGFVDAQSYIIAKINPQGKLLWADHLKCSDNAVGLAVEMDPSGNVYVAGSFSGTMGSMKTGSNSDVFLAKYTITGEKIWINNAGLDTIPQGAGLIYSLGFDKKGKKEVVRIVEYSPTYAGYGIFVTDTSVIFNGTMLSTLVPMKTTLAVNAVAEFDYADLLKKEYDQFVSRQTDRSVAGLFAISNIIKNAGVVISGKDVQKAFDKYNPGFKVKCPKMYKLIGKVSFMKNENNIITILTENGGDVLFNKLKLGNGSQLRISILPDGNVQVDALTGVKVGKTIIWYPLNYILVFSKTGDLLFDYDSDHSQARMNLRKDILN